MLVFEFCAESLTFIDKAIAAGAGRIELCDNLAVGGTTPSIGVINEAIKLTREKSVDLCVIIRPRGGDFVYTDLEVEAMLTDIRDAKEIGVTCFVLGALTMISEWKNIRAPWSRKLLAVVTFPLFMLTFIPVGVCALFCRRG